MEVLKKEDCRIFWQGTKNGKPLRRGIALYYHLRILDVFGMVCGSDRQRKNTDGGIAERSEKQRYLYRCVKRKIDRDSVITDMMLSRDDLSWVGIYVKGTRLPYTLPNGI